MRGRAFMDGPQFSPTVHAASILATIPPATASRTLQRNDPVTNPRILSGFLTPLLISQIAIPDETDPTPFEKHGRLVEVSGKLESKRIPPAPATSQGLGQFRPGSPIRYRCEAVRTINESRHTAGLAINSPFR